MSEWKECTLGDVITLQRGHDLTYAEMQEGNIPVIGSNGTIGYHNQKTCNAPCVTIGRSGSIGNTKYSNVDCWNYTYDDKGQLVDAVRTDPDDVEVNTMSYSYDEIGNRTSSSEDTLERSYTANDLNQYTSINSETPTYDADGNMLTNGSWTYTWNTENRLASATDGVSILEFKYDFMGRRVEKKVTQNAIIIKHENYVYDGYKLIAVYDALNENALVMSFVWQVIDLDVPLCMIYNGNTYFYLTDGNKNVTALFYITGNRVATYTYAPYGAILSSSGALSSINPFRFSSEYYDVETDLVYYNYRYYSPQLGRWTKRDSIAEQGGWNFYGMAQNNSVNKYDNLGLWGENIHNDATRRWAIQTGYTVEAAELIGISNEGVDGGNLGLNSSTSFLPVIGDQSYHFNRNNNGIDSRLQHKDEHLSMAKQWCNKRVIGTPYWDRNGYIHYYKESPFLAARELGIAMHPLQDWVAHGDYGIYDEGGIYDTHNEHSPQKDLLNQYGDVSHYPDNILLDAVNGPNGRPAGLAMTAVIKYKLGFAGVRLYANYKRGNQRLALTRQLSIEILAEYKKWLKENGTCKCIEQLCKDK